MKSLLESVLAGFSIYVMIITILILLIFSTIIQLFYWWIIAGRLILNKEKYQNLSNQPVSIVIAARNEESNILQLIEALKKLKFPRNSEVIIINDRSSDKTLELLEAEKTLFPQLKIISIVDLPIGWDGKKHAITKGIEEAKNEIVLLTDADCIPVSTEWISKMVSSFHKDTQVVLGVGKYYKTKSILNLFIQYETLVTATQYLSLALWGFPYMSVGRNVAYKKAAFLEMNYGKLQSHIGGDDDLMINRLANKENTEVVWSPIAQTISKPKLTYKEWFKQKRRHLSTGKYYSTKNKVILGLLMFSQLSFWLSSFYLLFYYQYLYLTLLLFLLRIISLNLVLKIIAQKCKFNINSATYVFLDFIHTLYLFIIGAISWFSKNTKWS